MRRRVVLVVGAAPVLVLLGLAAFWQARAPHTAVVSVADAARLPESTTTIEAAVDASPHPRYRPRSSAVPSPAPESLELSDRFTDERRLQHQANDELDVEDHVAARRAAQACLVINPTNRECFRAELSSYTRTGDLATARLLLDECLLDEPDDLDCLGARVTQHLRQGELTSARSVVDRLHHLAPDSGISHFADGEIAHRSGDRATAAAAYERACTDGQEFACDRARVLRGKLDSGTD